MGAVSITTGTMRRESSAATEISRSTLLDAMAAGETTSSTTSDSRMAVATEVRHRSLPRMSSVSIHTSWPSASNAVTSWWTVTASCRE